jgi:hypothetical protein
VICRYERTSKVAMRNGEGDDAGAGPGGVIRRFAQPPVSEARFLYHSYPIFRLPLWI